MPGLPPNHSAFAHAALSSYGRDPDAPLRLLSLSENATYLVDDERPMVLRVHRPGYHSLPAIRSELTWMRALRTETPVITPELVRARDGSDVLGVEVDGVTLHVDGMGFVPGCTAEETSGVVGYGKLGQLTAHMHDHAQRWRVPQEFTRFRWDLESMFGPRARWGDWRQAPGMTDQDRATVDAAVRDIIGRITEYGYGPDRFGLIHADMRLSNLMVDPGRPGSDITVIDFDDCGWSWFMADLGAVVSWVEDTPEAEVAVADWLEGYRRVCRLSDEHLAMIPVFVMLRRVMLTAWIASHADADAAIRVSDGFGARTARLAQRYLTDQTWLREAVFGRRVG
ncbi:phosphotransferase enzyme family protein [Mycobacteroides immunogenum]|uniref:Aminoglycoside phosphotransferase n=1 Tax=Mycobacteroides immunogenum TaxID=83262 RepID=A0A7V8LKB1_9MYCO|nr:phosphotransferase [Mycobacteroides immunogenum]AMT69802.1 aminoglycoside phosphotransferase [Mycobacteroides immunogenum]ANO02853.1 aminoglycoside phosphotransferase [Mycobacteroides immunogenum]KIU39202.1 aminoglycoside phosphotransferase [Mycobacteroides immunogenum]KPG03150.1 aminoglycoside phosphotransferase [Mycobacteroides immunogenum]KPG03850.1 aminoglycoside phosphotransferase [Mycobacteroides immunogenum]